MTVPTYKMRAGWLGPDWAEIGSSYSWAQLCDGFRWHELMAGAVPDADVEQIQISRQASNISNRLTTGQARIQLDNSRGQYTDVGSNENLVPFSETLNSAATALGATLLDNFLPQMDGNQNGAKIVESSGGTLHGAVWAGSFAVISGQVYTALVDLKGAERTALQWNFQDVAQVHVIGLTIETASKAVTGNFITGSASLVSTSAQILNDGWVRYSMAARLPTSMAAFIMLMNNSAGVSYSGNGSAGLFVARAQVYDGIAPFAYQPTIGAPIRPSGAEININDVVGVWALSGSSVFGLYSGYVDRWDAAPALKDGRKLTVQAADIASRLRPVISTSLMINPTQSAVYQAILSAANIPADRYVLDQHNELLQFAFLDQITAGDAIADVQQNGAQFIYVDGRGRMQIKNRNFDVPSVAGFGPYSQVFALSQSLDDSNVINQIQVTTTPREPLLSLNTVGWISDPVFIAAAGSVDFLIDFVDPLTNERGAPVKNIQSMMAGVDFIFTANVDGGGTVQTACLSLQMTPNATSARIQAANVGSGANNGYLTTCQLKGYAVSAQPDLSLTVTDAASVAKYQPRFLSITAEMLGTKNRASDLGEFMLVTGSTPRALTTLGLMNEFPDVIQIDLLSRIGIMNSAMQIGSSFIAMGIDHTIVFDAGPQHTLSIDCELAPLKNYFVLDSNILGHLDLNRLGF